MLENLGYDAFLDKEIEKYYGGDEECECEHGKVCLGEECPACSQHPIKCKECDGKGCDNCEDGIADYECQHSYNCYECARDEAIQRKLDLL